MIRHLFKSLMALVVAVGLGFFGAYCVGHAVSELVDVWRSPSWPVTRGRIILSGPLLHGNGLGSPRGSSLAYYPRVNYVYAVDGRAYRSSQISIGGKVCFTELGVEEAENSYPRNSWVNVHYRRSDPQDGVLEPGWSGNWTILFNLGLGVLALAVAVTEIFWLRLWLLLGPIMDALKQYRRETGQDAGDAAREKEDTKTPRVAAVVVFLAGGTASLTLLAFGEGFYSLCVALPLGVLALVSALVTWSSWTSKIIAVACLLLIVYFGTIFALDVLKQKKPSFFDMNTPENQRILKAMLADRTQDGGGGSGTREPRR